MSPNSSLVDYAGQKLEPQTLAAFLTMAEAAKKDDIELAICSAYRSFERQLAIFNAKANGSRPLLDKNSHPVDTQNLNEAELLDTILIWSALPGSSRHHWGTDIDLFDASTVDKASLQLVCSEYEQGGLSQT